jgi:hypothetical protein
MTTPPPIPRTGAVITIPPKPPVAVAPPVPVPDPQPPAAAGHDDDDFVAEEATTMYSRPSIVAALPTAAPKDDDIAELLVDLRPSRAPVYWSLVLIAAATVALFLGMGH